MFRSAITTLLLSGVVAIALLGVPACGGGGGGGGGSGGQSIPVTLLDVYPTLLALAGLRPPAGIGAADLQALPDGSRVIGLSASR